MQKAYYHPACAHASQLSSQGPLDAKGPQCYDPNNVDMFLKKWNIVALQRTQIRMQKQIN